jgi:hypothetical protein
MELAIGECGMVEDIAIHSELSLCDTNLTAAHALL